MLSSRMEPTATARKASARRAATGPTRPLRLTVTGQAEAVAGAEHRLYDDGLGGIPFDLAAQGLDVGVDGSFVAFELVTAYPVDQLIPRVDTAGHSRKGGQDAPFCGGELDRRASYGDRVPLLVKDHLAAAVGDRTASRRGVSAPAEDGLG